MHPLPLPHGDREVVSERPSAQVYQIQVEGEKYNEESIVINKKISAKYTRKK